MTMVDWIEFLTASEKYDIVCYEAKIKVLWQKKKVAMGCLTTPIFLFGHRYLMPFGDLFSSS